LLLAAMLLVTLALSGAAVLTDLVLDRFLHRQIDAQLDSRIGDIRAALIVAKDGQLSLKRDLDGPPFDRPGAGWYWSITDGRTALHSASLGTRDITLPAGPAPPIPLPPPPPGAGTSPPPLSIAPPPPRPADGLGPDAQPLHSRIATFTVAGRVVTVIASAPAQAFRAPLREAMTAVLLSLGIAAFALIAALYLQVRLGLRPLARLRRAVTDIRAGRIRALPANQPSEIAPLAQELNRLIAENAQSLARARRHVANLAHGLKTPLANLTVALEESAVDPDGELRAMVGLMDRRVQHHLRRARVAALEGTTRAQTLLAPHVADLAAVLGKIYAERNIVVATEIDASLTVACEGQDVDEMLGNLMDNAFQWTATFVRITARAQNGQVLIAVEDDGAGLAPNSMTDMLAPGKRLDESAPGYGFGLPITNELVELYGGTLTLEGATLGGLNATLRIPKPS
jgi:signal transduction histidine kinase